MTEEDPSILLPRDETGRYLHLKLKRFASIGDLSMPYALTTWKKTPHDAEVDVSPSARSSCRYCRDVIEKGDLRFRLWLQCHKGCKISAYFHSSCFYEYPETKKLESVGEIMGYGDLETSTQDSIRESFRDMKAATEKAEESKGDDIEAKPAKKKRKLTKK